MDSGEPGGIHYLGYSLLDAKVPKMSEAKVLKPQSSFELCAQDLQSTEHLLHFSLDTLALLQSYTTDIGGT